MDWSTLVKSIEEAKTLTRPEDYDYLDLTLFIFKKIYS